MENRESSKQLIHALYNDLAQHGGGETDELREVLLKAYAKIGLADNNPPLVNHLVNFIYYKEYNEHLLFTANQQALIRRLSDIGSKAAFNKVYRSDFGDIGQFD